jgi:hypothetical protein
MDELSMVLEPVLVERGEDNTCLVVAFTGWRGQLNVPVYEFFETTKSLRYNRILLWDQYNMYYHHGIDPERPDFPSLMDFLKKEMDRLNPQKVICVGSSAGGYAAIVAGHRLGADYVHAFGPQTFLEFRPRELQPWQRPSRLKLLLSRRASPEFFDLAPMLTRPNGQTTYFVHYCRGCEADNYHAQHISGLPDVVTIGYPCYTHGVAIYMAKQHFLGELLDIANQHRMIDLAQAYFPKGLQIRKPHGARTPFSALRSKANQGEG